MAPAPLYGTVLRPESQQPSAVALILAGSGPTDRDGNQPGLANNSLKLLAQGLAAHGIASLRIDKRGVGGSQAAAPAERDLRLTTYVDDARQWLAFLRQQHFTRYYLIGHSEGALIATLAAQAETVSGLILLAGAGETTADLIRQQLRTAGASAGLLQIYDSNLKELQSAHLIQSVPPELAELFRPSLQSYLRSWLFLDPAAELAKTAMPALIIQGSHDLQVSQHDAELLAAAKPAAQHVVIDGMNHILKMAPLDRAANIASYNDPSLPLAPGLMPLIASFITAA